MSGNWNKWKIFKILIINLSFDIRTRAHYSESFYRSRESNNPNMGPPPDPHRYRPRRDPDLEYEYFRQRRTYVAIDRTIWSFFLTMLIFLMIASQSGNFDEPRRREITISRDNVITISTRSNAVADKPQVKTDS